MKPIYKTLSALILIAAAFLFGKSCSNNKSAEPNPAAQHYIDSINLLNKYYDNAVKDLLTLVASGDSVTKELKSRKPERITRYITAKSARTEIGTDSLKNLVVFDQVTQSCDSLLSLNDSIITQYEQKDSILQGVIKVQDQQLGNKDLIIDLYFNENEALKSEAKRDKRKQRLKSFLIGLGSGLIVGGVVGLVR